MLLSRKPIAAGEKLDSFERDNPATISYDIDSANNRAKQLLHQNNSRLQLTERARLLRRKHLAAQHVSVDQVETSSQQSLSSLRKERQKEEKKQQQILNRLNFVEKERQRNQRTAEWARRKYSVLVDRRTQNLQMKEALSRDKSVIERQNAEYIRRQREKSRIERQQKERNLRSWRNQYQQEALHMKQMKQETREKLTHIREENTLRNRHRAMDVKQKEFDLLSKKSAMSESRKQEARHNWQERLVSELNLKKDALVLTCVMQKRNKQLFHKLVLRTDTVRKASQRARSQLEKLEDVMTSTRSRVTPSASRNSRSFFITKD